MKTSRNTSATWPSEFINQYPISKTLRFKLIPQGKTQEWIIKEGFLEADEQRAENSKKVKEFIDDYHRWFINDVLRSVEIGGWDELEKALNSSGGAGEGKSIAQLQEKQRKSLVKCFSARPEFGALTNKPGDLFKKDLPAWMKTCGYTEQETKLVASFNGFIGYFSKLKENRNNMYVAEPQATAIAYRAVNENFSKYSANKKMINSIKHDATSISAEINALSPKLPYNMYLSPQGISNYNEQIGELNKFLNEAYQKGFLTKRHRAQALYKQILCEGDGSFAVPPQIENDTELFETIQKLLNYWESLENEGSAQAAGELNPLVASQTIAEMLAQADASMVFIDGRNLFDFAATICNGKKELLQAVEYCASEQCGPAKTKKIAEKWNARKGLFSIAELIEAHTTTYPESEALTLSSISKKYAEKIQICCDKIANAKSAFERLEASYQNGKQTNSKALIANDKDIQVLKNLLDGLKNLERTLRIFEAPADKDRDEAFYAFLDSCEAQIMCVDALYNRVRNYVTQKPFSNKKFKLNFDCSTLGNGWDKSKERDNHCVILRKDNLYYLGITNPSSKIDFSNYACEKSIAHYEKMTYKLLPNPNQMLPKVSISSKRGRKAFPPRPELYDGYQAGKHKKDNFDQAFCFELIDYFKNVISEYPGWEIFDFKFSATEAFSDISGFYREVANQGYYLGFDNCSKADIDKLVATGQLYLFQIYNKDYSSHSTGNKNLHTLFWEQVFSAQNAKHGYPFRLNGGAELFYRRGSIKKLSKHNKGSVLLNKTYTDQEGIRKAIPNDIYTELSALFNDEKTLADIPAAILNEAKELYDSGLLETRKAPHDIVKDKRYTQDQFAFHVPITLNANSVGNNSVKSMNNMVLKHATKDKNVTILGVDRGERHLLYLCLINQNGEILMQKTLNTVSASQRQGTVEVDYHQKLNNREKDRDKARKSWQSIGRIAELKEGYLSQVIHEIAEIATNQNAIVVMEDLNFGFKRGRFKVEKQVYQKFEKQLIDKFSYLAKKPNDKIGIWDDGGIGRAYQLVPKFESFQKLGKQHGAIFYVPAWNTSHIDPATGFMNQFKFPKDTTEFWREFFSSMRSISFNEAEGYFEFSFAYSEFPTYMTRGKDEQDTWTVCSWSDSYLVNRRDKDSGKWITELIDANEQIKSLLTHEKIDYADNADIKKQITQISDKGLKQLGYLFRRIIQLRNSRTGTDEDYILSPVKGVNNTFFDSRKAPEGLPQDADANGAYHIALKGLQALEDIEQDSNGLLHLAKTKKGMNEKWTRWIQRFHSEEK